MVVLQDDCAEHRRERDSATTPESTIARRHRDGKLAVEDTNRARHEGHWNKHGGHEQGDGDDGAADLADYLLHRIVGGQVRFFFHLRVDGLDDDDRVVDDDADRKDEREERDQVDRDPERLHEEERADERHWNRQDRDQGRAPVAQEDEDDERHQHEGLAQRVEDLLDGGIEEARDVVVDFVVHPTGERRLLDLLELGLHVRNDLTGVASGGLLQDDRGRRIPVQVGVDVEELASELDLRDVFQPKGLAVLVGPNDDVLVLIGFVESSLIGQNVFERLGLHARRLPEPPWRSDDALFADRLHHVVGRNLVGAHLVRIEPDTHRVLP